MVDFPSVALQKHLLIPICTKVTDFHFLSAFLAFTSTLSPASIFLKVPRHNSLPFTLCPIVLGYKRVIVCGTRWQGDLDVNTNSTAADHYVWPRGLVKGERSEFRDELPLRESPLSTALYIAGRERVFPSVLSSSPTCHVVNGGHVNHTVCRNWWWWNKDDCLDSV